MSGLVADVDSEAELAKARYERAEVPEVNDGLKHLAVGIHCCSAPPGPPSRLVKGPSSTRGLQKACSKQEDAIPTQI